MPSDPAFRILVSDGISPKGVDLLNETPGMQATVNTGLSPAELAATIGDYDALVVRSATKVTAEVLKNPGKLRVIGRAGTGVDNIDLEAATRAGVVVVNTPGGNSVAAAEQTFTLLLALARNVVQANHELREGRWERKKYMGVEVAGKTLGVVGLGRIGREVALRAKGFRMEVLGYDPYVSSNVVADCGIQSVTLEELIARSDFVTLHLPVSTETRHVIDAEMLKRFKPGSRLINCARGGLIDEAALYEALEAGRIAGVALDVFENEPPEDRRLVEHPRAVCTPHLGASTREAQERVGTEIAAKIRDYLESGVILDAVNFPAIDREEYATLGPMMSLAAALGSFLSQIVEDGAEALTVGTFGTFSEHPLRPLAMAAAKGLLSPVIEGGLSYVNSLALARERGIKVEESRSSETSPYAGLLRLTLNTGKQEATVAGTLFGADHARMVEIDGLSIECELKGHMLFLHNRDVPGVVGRIGSILGKTDVNIAGLQLGRTERRSDAVTIINVDGPVSRQALSDIRDLGDVVFVRAVEV
jgi:D-3-phosphoglycerate dehydrogenase